VADEKAKAHAWREEAFDHHKGRLGLGESLGEVEGSRKAGGEPVA